MTVDISGNGRTQRSRSLTVNGVRADIDGQVRGIASALVSRVDDLARSVASAIRAEVDF